MASFALDLWQGRICWIWQGKGAPSIISQWAAKSDEGARALYSSSWEAFKDLMTFLQKKLPLWLFPLISNSADVEPKSLTHGPLKDILHLDCSRELSWLSKNLDGFKGSWQLLELLLFTSSFLSIQSLAHSLQYSFISSAHTFGPLVLGLCTPWWTSIRFFCQEAWNSSLGNVELAHLRFEKCASPMYLPLPAA